MKKILPRFLLAPLAIVLFGGLAFCLVALEIDPGGQLPSWPEGPGLTLDEGFNVEEGVRLVAGLKGWANGTLTWEEVFGRKENLGAKAPLGYHLADHPPGGRVWLGLWHNFASALFGTSEDDPNIVVAYARLGSAAAFGLLITLIGLVTWWWYGAFAGIVSALSLLLMPRLFGHAHLAALETVMNLTYAAAILSVAAWWKHPEDTATRPPKFLKTAFAGFVWGLALLTKIQAVLIAPVVVVWAVWHWRRKAVVPLLVWGGLGLLIFFAGWPWLWFDPWEYALQYFRSSTERATLYVWYFGERYADTAVPWHYPFVIFLATMPVGFVALGIFGFAARDIHKQPLRRDGKLQLVLAAGLFPLVLFAVPGVAVYDGARLFLISAPLWAIAVGRGASAAWHGFSRPYNPKLAAVPLVAILLCHGYEVLRVRPVYLSYYSLALGGLPRAEKLGMELNYWGDGLTRELWNEVAAHVPPGSTVHVTPVLHPLQLRFLESQLPQLRDKRITLKPAIPERTGEVKYLVLFERKADLAPEIVEAVADVSPQFAVERQGVRLAAFFRLGQDSE